MKLQRPMLCSEDVAELCSYPRVTGEQRNFERCKALANGTQIHVDLIGPEDRDDLVAGFHGLSPRSRYLRFFSAMPHLRRPLLDRLLNTDAEDSVAIAARLVGPDRVLPAIVGIARYFRIPHGAEGIAELAISVIDSMQGRGLGTLLIKTLADHARSRGITKMRVHVLADNAGMRRILTTSAAVLVERDGAALVYDVDIQLK